jgi:sulfofructose kinase
MKNIDVLSVGHASFDMVFSVDHHPLGDEKIFAYALLCCGGGPAANAAVMVARLGLRSAFAGYLGQDVFGEQHLQELIANGVDTGFIVRGVSATPLSTILVKPDGKRALINFKGETRALAASAIDFFGLDPKVILFDGHEPELSVPLVEYAREKQIPTILDAGSVHDGTLALMEQVDYLVCSEKFALQYAGDENKALSQFAHKSANVVITLGERGLIWQRGLEKGAYPAFPVSAKDTTGAGDAFHGAFAAAVATDMAWTDSLRYASAAGALCCTQIGARAGLPTFDQHQKLFNS